MDMTSSLFKKTTSEARKLFSLGRSALYLAESLPFILLSNTVINRGKNVPPSTKELKTALKETYDLHMRDLANIEKDIYPGTVLDVENPLIHSRNLFYVLADSLKVAYRMKMKQHKDFSEEAKEFLQDLPEYYTRNFHFQTDGYLSENSAKLYDHQVEILFNGTAQPMRRLSLPPIREKFGRQEHLDILDIACGPGSLTKDLAITFPQSNITAFDLSFPYLKEAQRKLSRFPRINFVQGNAEKLPFKDKSFDVVTCCYLFHELPDAARKNVIREAYRVCRPNGIVVLTDSIQNGDAPELEWAIHRFPQNYHEPFYKNYLDTPLEKAVFDIQGTIPATSRGLFTKAIYVEA